MKLSDLISNNPNAGMAAGLFYANSKDIVYLDFKPGNLFILRGGVVNIFDFGIRAGSECEISAYTTAIFFAAGDPPAKPA